MSEATAAVGAGSAAGRCGAVSPSPAAPRAPCADCAAREACAPGAVAASRWGRGGPLCTLQRVAQGQALYRTGERFRALYAIRAGSFKSQMVGEGGRGRMTGVHLRGELVGTEGIADELHASDLLALQDSEVCVIPFARLRRLMADVPRIQRWLIGALGKEIVMRSNMIALLGCRSAEERVAAFLLNLSARLAARGHAADEFDLRVTRRDVASHLGLSAETMSRVLTRFAGEGLVHARSQHVRLLDIARLKERAAGAEC